MVQCISRSCLPGLHPVRYHKYVFTTFQILTVKAYRTSACAIHGNRYPIAIEQGRKLINTHQFNNEPFRILLASLGHGMQATDAFLASTLSKHLLRELKTGDTALRNKEGLRWNNVTKRYAPVGSSSKAEDDEEEEDGGAGPQAETGKDPPHVTRPNLPTKHNPMSVAVYGQICLTAKSYQSALCEPFRTGESLSPADFWQSIFFMPTSTVPKIR